MCDDFVNRKRQNHTQRTTLSVRNLVDAIVVCVCVDNLNISVIWDTFILQRMIIRKLSLSLSLSALSIAINDVKSIYTE